MPASKRLKRDSTRGSNSKSRDCSSMDHKLVEAVNALSASDFYDRFAPTSLTLMLFDGLEQPSPLLPRYGDAATLLGVGDSLLKECLQLIELTSARDYENSEIKWSASKKWKEMKLPDMKYIILHTPDGVVAGFISFMVTYEDGKEVVYIYEIHLVPEWQSQGLGRRMMHIAEAFAQNVKVSKVMLTVFRANEKAVDWYLKQGYQEDEFSPGPRKLRNGTVKQPSYIILSKQVER